MTTASAYTVDLAEGQDYLNADFGVQAVLPVTGFDADEIAILSLVLLTTGALAVLITRRRENEEETG